MIEVFAVGAAAAITSLVAKGLSPLFRSVADDIRNPTPAVKAFQVATVPLMPLMEAKARYGEPVVYWDNYDHASVNGKALDFGPKRIVHPEGDNAVVWSFFLVKDEARSVLVRVAGGNLYRPAFQQQLAGEARDKVTMSYQRSAFETRAAAVAAAAAQERTRLAEIAANQAAKNAELARVDQEQRDRDARLARLSGRIPLAPTSAGIVFGTRIRDGVDFVVPLKQLQHMLVSGVSGAGKTTFVHQILVQLLQSAEVERLILIDLKGGVSFHRYRQNPKVEAHYEIADVMSVIDGLMPLMAERQRIMRETGVELYRGGKIFIVIDEYAEIQTEIDTADGKDAKLQAKRLAANLASIARRARALGIILICSLQRPTLDSMDAAVRNNLGCRICLRAATNQLAASMLDDVDRLPVSPTTLPDGRFYYYDASRGVTRFLQAQIAPGVDLGDG